MARNPHHTPEHVMFPSTNNTTPTPGSTPTSQPSAQNQPQNQPEYLTKEEFSRSAAFIRGLSEKLDGLVKAVPTMDMFVQLGMLEKKEDGTYAPKTATPPVPVKKENQPDPVAEMEARFQSELKKRDDALSAERRKASETEKRSAIVDSLNKAGAVNAGRDVIHVTGITKNSAGQYVQVTKDEFGADKEISLDEAVASFLKANPELKKTGAHTGSGTPTGNVSRQGTFTGNVVSWDMLQNPEWYAKNREAIMNGTIQFS